ncbi:MAG: hypothetical protein L0221_00950 [Chloroflexi bacterium]|nr:hypothetical protein [Chloroflexota bacterium]
MSNDMDKLMRDSIADLPLPPAPHTLHATLDRLELEPVASRRVRQPANLSIVTVVVGVLVVATVMVMAGRSSTLPGMAPSTASATPSPPSSPATADELVATDRGLSMTVVLDRTELAPGASLAIGVRIENSRSVAVALSVD